MPEFEVADTGGKALSINSVITGGSKPVLVIFAYFPADTKFGIAAETARADAKAETDKAKSAGGFFGGMAKAALKAKASSASGDAGGKIDELTGRDAIVTYPKLLDKVELQFFGNDVNSIPATK
jgi:hypothetical protein